MLRTFHQGLLAYANHRWGQRIFVWSSVAIFLGAIVLAGMLGLTSGAGSAAASSQVSLIFVGIVAIPLAILFNLALAVVFATAWTLVWLVRGCP